MSTIVVNYAFKDTKVANPDGTLSAVASGCSVVAGPGATTLGTYPSALGFGSAGKLRVDLPLNQLSAQSFCVRTVVKVDAPVTSRQNLVESNAVPFSVYLDAIPGSSDFQAVVAVAPSAYGWTGATTQYSSTPLHVGTWYAIDLIYDLDTLGVAVNGVVVAVVAFPNGAIPLGTAPALFVGTSTDGSKFHFSGSMAALQLYNGVPSDLEALLDEKRNSPEWYISHRYLQLKPTLNLGGVTGPISFDAVAGAYTQVYSAGLLMFAEEIGGALEMHGAIFTAYQALANKSELGYLVSDEVNAAVSGARKNLFSQGGIYWSGSTGAVPVLGQIYLAYEAMGESHAIGLPTAAVTAVAGGEEQIFQGARMYLKSGAPRAFAVQGAILTRFLASGGVSTWGFPVSNEFDVKKGTATVGRASEFEGCTFYWSSATGACEVHGAIRDTYNGLGGAIGQLGFPTSDEQNVPGASAPARCNSFQNGSLFWFGGDVIVCHPYKIFVGRFDTRNSEGFMMGQNDLYFRITIEDNGHSLLNVRYPESGAYDGHDVLDFNQQLPITLTPNNISSNIKITFDIWESDNGAPFGGGDDYMGTYSYTLNAANAFGLRTNNGVMNTGSFQMVNSITWAVQPLVNAAALSDVERWWGVKNRGTDALSYHQYAASFSDVDPSPGLNDPQNWIQDGLQGIFYLAAVKGIAGGGNCFGMSLEGIYSRKGRSLLSMPINRFTDWSTVVDAFNLKHEYQVGASPIWWFVGEFLSGETHDPVSVFNSTRDSFNRGDNPVLNVAQNYDFSGAPHSLMPVGWDSSSKPWQLKLCDPNFPGQVRTLYVDPDANTYSYDGGSNKYSGGAWSGGRMHYTPYCVVNDQQRTPVWDAIMLLVAGTILILGSDGDTVAVTDENGVDINAFGADAVARLKAKQPLTNKLVGFKGFNDGAAVKAEVYLRTRQKSAFTPIKAGLLDGRVGANLTVGEVAQSDRAPAPLKALVSDGARFRALQGRDVKSVVNDPKAMAGMDAAVATALGKVVGLRSVGTNIRHQVKGNKPDGHFQYMVKKGLSEITISVPLGKNEVGTVSLDDLGTSSAVVGFAPSSAKVASFQMVSHIGADRVQITINNLATDATTPLKVNVKPGLGGLDILAKAAASHPEVIVETTLGGKASTVRYALPFSGNLRIRPSTIGVDQSLKVSRITGLFGPLQDSVQVKPRP